MRPGTTIPQALAVTVIIVVLTYTVPIIIGCAHVIGDDGSGSGGDGDSGSGSTNSLALGAIFNANYASGTDDQWSNWRDGHFATIAEEIGGRWLGLWLLGAAAVSAMGQYLSEMSSNSFQLEGMAQRRQLPGALRFGHRSRHGTSTTGIFASFFICVLMGVLEIDMVVEATNCLYCVSALLEFAAFLRLRCVASSPKLKSTSVNDVVAHAGDTGVGERFVIPLGTIGCALMLFPAAVSIVLVRMCLLVSITFVCVRVGAAALAGGSSTSASSVHARQVLCLASPTTTLLGSCIVMAAPIVFYVGNGNLHGRTGELSKHSWNHAGNVSVKI